MMTQLMSIASTASWEELLVIVLGMAALTYNVVNYLASHIGVRQLKREGINGRYLRVARQFRRNDAGRALKQVGFLVIWVLAALSANPVGDTATVRTAVLRAILVGMQAWLVWGAYLDKRDREWLQAHPRDVGEHEHEEDYDAALHTGAEQEAR